MLNLLTSSQTRDADAHTIALGKMSSSELMEKASQAFVREFKKEVPDLSNRISIFCGTGNNGGDGLAIARILKRDGYPNISVKIVRFSARSTDDFENNLKRLDRMGIPVSDILEATGREEENTDVIIDALVGSGLNKPAEGDLEQVISRINRSGAKIISVDVPSGFFAEGMIDPAAVTIKASLVISFQRPKINFFFPESEHALERFKAVPIGLDEEYIRSLPGHWKLTEKNDIDHILNPRKNFSHKGTYGHALIIAGAEETMGAALLCAEACLHSGAGLTTAYIPKSGLTALNTRSPEIMALSGRDRLTGSALRKYSSIAFGPGTGTGRDALQLLEDVLSCRDIPLVIDADGLNLLAANPELLGKLPGQAILTPHMKEFDRMFGEHLSWWERIETGRAKAASLNAVILLKNQYSFIILPDGDVLINPTGNPAMASGGMGDVLTGMIAAFLAQGYQAKDAAILACYLHGLIGDEMKAAGMKCIPPRYLVERIPFLL